MKTYDSKRIPLTHKNHSRHIEQDGEGTKKKNLPPRKRIKKRNMFTLRKKGSNRSPRGSQGGSINGMGGLKAWVVQVGLD